MISIENRKTRARDRRRFTYLGELHVVPTWACEGVGASLIIRRTFATVLSRAKRPANENGYK